MVGSVSAVVLVNMVTGSVRTTGVAQPERGQRPGTRCGGGPFEIPVEVAQARTDRDDHKRYGQHGVREHEPELGTHQLPPQESGEDRNGGNDTGHDHRR
jgi:hypothetical protein